MVPSLVPFFWRDAGFTLAAILALAIAHGSESFAGLVPCALCLWERWPYRLAVVFGIAAAVLPEPSGRVARGLVTLAFLTAAVLAAVHVGVEQGWWPSPLAECAAPVLGGGSIAERLARMPAAPAKPCDEATYLIPGLPLSMAAMNFVYALVLTGAAAGTALRFPGGQTQ